MYETDAVFPNINSSKEHGTMNPIYDNQEIEQRVQGAP